VSDAVEVTRQGAVQLITINRPEARNALNRAVADGISAAVDELDASRDLQVGVLTGAGGVFSAGMDLKAWVSGETPEIDGRGLCGITRQAPAKPLIAAVEGWALAGGFELVLACDLVVAGQSAKFGVPEVKRSLVAGGGGALLLPQRVPRAVALELLLTGDAIDAERARAVGLLNRVVPDGHAVAAAVQLADVIAANGPLAIAATKRIALQGPRWPPDRSWDLQAEVMNPVFSSADALEGAAAFAEKRTPVWRAE
jgi:enoyl-CoA hydratase